MSTVSPNARRALVLGSTGLIGEALTRVLDRHPAYEQVVCLVRRPTGRSFLRAEERTTDFSALDATTIPAADDVYCAIGTTMRKAGSQERFREVDVALPLRLATLARQAGAQRMALVSSVGASPAASSFYLRCKAELEAEATTLGYSPLCIFRPGLLLGERREARPAEAVARAVVPLFSGLLMGKLRIFRPIDAEVVAKAMVQALVSDRTGRSEFLEFDETTALASAFDQNLAAKFATNDTKRR